MNLVYVKFVLLTWHQSEGHSTLINIYCSGFISLVKRYYCMYQIPIEFWPNSIKFKMAATLNVCLQMTLGISTVKLVSIWQGILILLSINKIKDGWHGSHLENVTGLYIERNIVLLGPKLPCESRFDRTRHSHSVHQKPNSRWLPQRPSWKCNRAIHREERSPPWSQAALRISLRSDKAFPFYWAETKIKMAAVAAILKMWRGLTSKGT